MSDVYVMNKMTALNECIRIHHDVKNSGLGIDPPSFIPDELVYLVDDEEIDRLWYFQNYDEVRRIFGKFWIQITESNTCTPVEMSLQEIIDKSKQSLKQ